MPGDSGARRQRRVEGLATERRLLSGDPEAVRAGLAELLACPMLSRLSEESRGTVEIVLAEVLNNITEHAYARYPGDIAMSVTAHDSYLFVRLVDTGLPMPGGEPPPGRPRQSAEIQDLPEGGFGWFLIRSLTQELTYQREGASNTLSFCLDVEYRD